MNIPISKKTNPTPKEVLIAKMTVLVVGALVGVAPIVVSGEEDALVVALSGDIALIASDEKEALNVIGTLVESGEGELVVSDEELTISVLLQQSTDN